MAGADRPDKDDAFRLWNSPHSCQKPGESPGFTSVLHSCYAPILSTIFPPVW
jgi:hypothetical protein